jgi:hypothetical protein
MFRYELAGRGVCCRAVELRARAGIPLLETGERARELWIQFRRAGLAEPLLCQWPMRRLMDLAWPLVVLGDPKHGWGWSRLREPGTHFLLTPEERVNILLAWDAAQLGQPFPGLTVAGPATAAGTT